MFEKIYSMSGLNKTNDLYLCEIFNMIESLKNIDTTNIPPFERDWINIQLRDDVIENEDLININQYIEIVPVL